MESLDNDMVMTDISGLPPRDDLQIRRAMNGSLISAATSNPKLVNSFNDLRRDARYSIGVERPSSSLRQVSQSSREASYLAKDVAEHLSINTSGGSNTPSEDPWGEDAAMEVQQRKRLAMLKTGLCYDIRMRYHCELDPPKLRVDVHPEDPRRIFHIYDELCKAGLVDGDHNDERVVPGPLTRIFARPATASEICLVHDRKHYDFIASTKDMTEDELVHLERQYDSIYFNKLTFASALLSAGGAIDTCAAVVAHKLRNAIAVIRPPGHHAECNRPMGFCLFDNVSIAAKCCQLDYPDICRKILIVDWDVHHGNGIQQAFYQDPNVLYISIHVHEDGNFYPPGDYGDHYHCGAGPGLGKNINIPWPTKGMGDADYLFAFQNIVMPVAYEFDPDLVIIAAGFDAAAGDQLGGCFVSPTCYAHMTHMLMPLAGGKLVVCLEGGYNLKSISKSALAVTRTLMSEPPDRMEATKTTLSGIATVRMVAAYQSRFWPCLFPSSLEPKAVSKLGYQRMHDVVRQYESTELYNDHQMINLAIFRDKLSKSFDKQVLATANYHKALPLMVFFHDPPDMIGEPNPITNSIDSHEIWVANGIKHYIDWAIKQGLEVIDINVPKYLTGLDGYGESSDEETAKRTAAIEELAVYMWENYIECNQATEIFFMGVGTAYKGILHLLNHREQFFHRISGIINFVADTKSLLHVSDQNTYYLSKWYKSNSLIFLPHEHLIWALNNPTKKPSKRFGNLIKCEEKDLSNMLAKHRDEVKEFVRGKMAGKSGVGGGRGIGGGGGGE